MQKVMVYLNNGTRKTINSTATKWGELKKEMEAHGVCYNQQKEMAVVGGSEVSLESPDAQLPTDQEYGIYLFPKLVKSGGDELPKTVTKEEALESINALMFNLETMYRNAQTVKEFITTTTLDKHDEAAISLREKLNQQMFG